jgi:molecular chaperone GrpE
MSAKKDRTPDADDSKNLANEIDRTMVEAEAAVSALDDANDSAEDGGDMDEAVDEEVDADEVIAQLQAELDATKDKWLRAVAEHENYKKRVKREMDDASVRSAQKLLPSFLPVIDNLERALEVGGPALEHADDANRQNVENLLAGIRMVQTEFLGALAKHGIEPVATVGVPFDPAIHDALQQFDSPEHPPGVVIREFEKGYKMGDRLLRPARVIVAGAGSTGTSEGAEG